MANLLENCGEIMRTKMPFYFTSLLSLMMLSNVLAQDFPKLSETFRLKQLEPPTGTIRMVLDTDTFNEVDDQFALAYTVLSKEKLKLEAVYAAPFHNSRSKGPGDGMEIELPGNPQNFKNAEGSLDKFCFPRFI